MAKKSLCILICTLIFASSNAQDAAYLKSNAVSIENPERLSDSIYHLLAPFQIIMFGEVHGTNESAPFVNGLANLFTAHGDSVQVGFEIPSSLMLKFTSLHTDSSIYSSMFFHNPPYLDGKESVAWASLISSLNRNPKAIIFFYDINEIDGKPYQRDSLMFSKIKMQFTHHPLSKMILLGGNYHNRVSEPGTTASYLNSDKELSATAKICYLNLEYQEGTCNADFGQGLEVKRLGHPATVYDTATGFNNYFILLPTQNDYSYNGFYYTRFITAAKMVSQQ